MEINSENYSKADYSLYQMSLAIDNIECIATAMDHRLKSEESYEANAIHFAAHYMKEELDKVRELLFG